MAKRNKIIVAVCFNNWEQQEWDLYFDGKQFSVFPQKAKEYLNEQEAEQDTATAKELVNGLWACGIGADLGLWKIKTNEFGDKIGASKIKSY